jgi:hypothetical protein
MFFMYALIITLMIALCSGCAPRYSDFFPYTDDGRKKPSLTLLPVYDGLADHEGAGFSAELSQSVYNRIKRRGELFIPPQASMKKALASLPEKKLFATQELKIFRRFAPTDYVCLMELKEYRVLPYKRGTVKPIYLANLPEEEARVLSIEVKLRIIDIREPDPKIIHQEVVQSNHMISKAAFEPGSSTAHSSSVEQVRSRLARDLAEKIEETLCLNK